MFYGKYRLEYQGPREYVYVPNSADPFTFIRPSGEKIVLDEPFVTDGASVPRVFWSLPGLSPWDFMPAALVHDWLWTLRYRGVLRCGFFASNRILREACLCLGYSRWKAWLIHRTVDLFGWYSWLRGEPEGKAK